MISHPLFLFVSVTYFAVKLYKNQSHDLMSVKQVFIVHMPGMVSLVLAGWAGPSPMSGG